MSSIVRKGIFCKKYDGKASFTNLIECRICTSDLLKRFLIQEVHLFSLQGFDKKPCPGVICARSYHNNVGGRK